MEIFGKLKMKKHNFKLKTNKKGAFSYLNLRILSYLNTNFKFLIVII